MSPVNSFHGRATKAYTHHLGSDDLVQEDWAGNVVWSFGKADQIEVEGRLHWSARQNHDFVREGAPVGYYVPGQAPRLREGRTLILSQKSGRWPNVTRDHLPRAARIIEVSWEGELLWDWMPAEHFEEFGHSEEARNTIMRGCRNQHCVFLNTVSRVGPNRWYDGGDERFHPDNVISDDRGTMIRWRGHRPANERAAARARPLRELPVTGEQRPPRPTTSRRRSRRSGEERSRDHDVAVGRRLELVEPDVVVVRVRVQHRAGAEQQRLTPCR